MDNKQQHGLHDSFFKQMFGQKKYLIEFLQRVLPPQALKYFDWQRLEIQDGEIIKRSGRKLQADLVASLRLKDTGNPKLMLSFIFEHKSHQDPNAIMQVIEYFVAIARKQARLHKQLIIPLVIMCCNVI